MAGITTQAEINMPTADMPLSFTPDQKPSQIWWRFWFDLLTRSLQTVQATVNAAVTAAGTTQATATALESEWNVITAGVVNTGVVLDGFNVGVSTTVFNQSGSAKNVYPPPGMSINALAVNTALSVANGAVSIFCQVSATQFLTSQ